MGVYITETRQSDSVYLDDGTYMNKTESIYIETPYTLDIFKSDKEQHTVFGWANVSLKADGSIPLDWEGDVIPPTVLEKAAYNFVLKYRETGEMHQGEAVGTLIESIMFTKEKMAKMGIPEGTMPEAWWVGFYIPDEEAWEKVKDGTYKMFSIQGKAIRV